MKKLLRGTAIVVTAGALGLTDIQQPAIAQGGPFIVYGPSQASCGVFTSAADDGARDMLEWWVLGFVSGVNYARAPHTLSDTDTEGIKHWIAKYCAEHPLDPFPKAALSLIKELERK